MDSCNEAPQPPTAVVMDETGCLPVASTAPSVLLPMHYYYQLLCEEVQTGGRRSVCANYSTSGVGKAPSPPAMPRDHNWLSYMDTSADLTITQYPLV